MLRVKSACYHPIIHKIRSAVLCAFVVLIGNAYAQTPSEFTIEGIVPAGATRAAAIVRVHAECPACADAPVAAELMRVTYAEESGPNRIPNSDFRSGLSGWGISGSGKATLQSNPGGPLVITAAPGETALINSGFVPATSGAHFIATFQARVNLPDAFHAGYFGVAFASDAANFPRAIRYFADPAPHIDVDYSRRLTVQSASGFLLSVGRTTPDDALVTPLRPAFWRVSNEYEFGDRIDPMLYSRLKRLGVKIDFIVSGVWGVPQTLGNHWPGWPFERWDLWESTVATSAQQARAAGENDLLWEIWNEPDQSFFWGGTLQQSFEAYIRANRVLRRELGANAPIGGPSIGVFNLSTITAFLDYCVAAGVDVNFIAWHENGSTDPWMIPDHVRQVRELIAQPKYAALHTTSILINEYGGPADAHSPASALTYLANLEQAHVDFAARSCWDSLPQFGIVSNECYDNSMDGLLTPTMQRRPMWWLYKLYADGVAGRVYSETSSPDVPALASSDGRVLIGRASNTAADLQLTLRGVSAVAGLSGAASVTVRIERLPAGADPIAGPELVEDELRAVSADSIVVPLHIEANDVLSVSLLPPTAPARHRTAHH